MPAEWSRYLQPDFLVPLLFLAFFAILFVQSGFDKIFDFKGNLDWLTGHFGAAGLAKAVPVMLVIVTLLEVASGILCSIALFSALFGVLKGLPTIALALCSITLLALFAGQRVAKDYAGAAALVPYFIASVLGLLSSAQIGRF